MNPLMVRKGSNFKFPLDLRVRKCTRSATSPPPLTHRFGSSLWHCLRGPGRLARVAFSCHPAATLGCCGSKVAHFGDRSFNWIPSRSWSPSWSPSWSRTSCEFNRRHRSFDTPKRKRWGRVRTLGWLTIPAGATSRCRAASRIGRWGSIRIAPAQCLFLGVAWGHPIGSLVYATETAWLVQHPGCFLEPKHHHRVHNPFHFRFRPLNTSFVVGLDIEKIPVTLTLISLLHHDVIRFSDPLKARTLLIL